MPTNYPGGIDSLNNPSESDFLDTEGVVHSVQHSNANDAIEAIETTLGINPQGTHNTVKDRLDNLKTWEQVTQAEYDALTPDENTLYIIVG